MSDYQIDDLERLTGIKAHTIRIWEKRYGLIEPFRTSTNRRYYNDTQVKKLLNVATLISTGEKISRVAAMSDAEINREIEQKTSTGSADGMVTGYINDLLASMLQFDEEAFEKIYGAAIIRLGIFETMVNVIYPFLKKVGILWSVSKTLPAQEHFASCIIKRKLNASIDGLKPPMPTSKKFLLMLPAGEWHEISLLFANYVIRSKGYATIYMGQNVPYENLETAVNIANPDFILLFYITNTPNEEINKNLKSIVNVNKHVQVLVAGDSTLLGREKMTMKRLHYLHDVTEIFSYLK